MGMRANIVVQDAAARACDLDLAFAGLLAADCRFSPFKPDSEVSRFNRGEIAADALTTEMRDVLALGERTRRESHGYFNMTLTDGRTDPCGIVKGWAVARAAQQLEAMGYSDFYVEVAGDIQCRGGNRLGSPWRVGVRNPFATHEIVKVICPGNAGIATSGSYAQGQHIYNPHAPEDRLDEILSLTVIGPDAQEADRFATAAFAMGRAGLDFIESLQGFEGYEIDVGGMARMTSGLHRYLTGRP